MVNRALIEKATPIPRETIMHDWWLALVAAASGVIHALPHATMLYRQHHNNTLGAQAFNTKHVMDLLSSRLKFEKDLQHVHQDQLHRQHKRLQAEILMERLQADLTSSQKEQLQAYCSLEQFGFLKSRLQILKHGLYKQGLLRNINLFTSPTTFP